jgi:hypothetical protein
MQFSYGAQSSALAERPRCWSKAFDDGARECRGCSFQVSCKEEIYRANAARQMAPPAPQPQYFQPYAVPQPVQVVHPIPQQLAVPTFKGLQVPAQPQQPQQPTLASRTTYPQPTQQYGYGWIQDPLYYALSSAPPPMRPQMGDETFFDRVVKNTGLAMLESFFGQCLIAVRQMVLPPTAKVIDVPPQQQQPFDQSRPQ